MFSVARRSSGRVCNAVTRGFAQVASQNSVVQDSAPSTPSPSSGDAWKHAKVPVNEAHGLWGFFRRKADANLSGEEAYETVQSARQMPSGRAWKATELRLKSFQDLHTLWYVTLRERNLLATQEEEARRMGIKIHLQAQTNMAQACRKTMARIKVVMNERRLAYEGALELLKNEQEQMEDKKLLQMQREALEQAQKKLITFTARNKLLRREKRRALIEGKKALEQETLLNATTAEAAQDAQASSTTPVETQATKPVESSPTSSETVTTASTSEPTSSQAPPVPEGPSRPQTAAETATAGLFGEVPRK